MKQHKPGYPQVKPIPGPQPPVHIPTPIPGSQPAPPGMVIPTPMPKVRSRHYSSIDMEGLQVTFQRTLRVPSGQINALPAGLGAFPIYKVADYASGTPSEWRSDASFIPMWRSEAMWMNFSGHKPKALIVGAGDINAINGKPFRREVLVRPSHQPTHHFNVDGLDVRLEQDQNYLVTPPQPWLDGFKAMDGKVYQFVAAELGSGQTVEGQITGRESVGGIQLIAYDAKPGMIPDHNVNYRGGNYEVMCQSAGSMARRSATSMGLGKGGEIKQKIYPDSYGLHVWQTVPSSVEKVHIVSAEDFRQITGDLPPNRPITRAEYDRNNIPWFDLYDDNLGDVSGSSVFDHVKPVDGYQGGNLLDKLE